jgi:hypothetical protein
MAEMSSWEPYGARLVSMQEVEENLTSLIRLYDHLAILSRSPDVAERNKAHAANWRALRWLIAPTDRVWLLTEPPEHPDFIHGTAYLVVVRNGGVIAKHKICAA